jgi:hypothetical protein
MGKSKGSLKGYELTNLLFFLVIIVVLVGGCWWVFYHIGTKDRVVVKEIDPGISSEQTTEDIALFYLEGLHIVGVTRSYRSRLEIPSTDDGLIRGLFDLPGVEEITIQPQLIILKKNGTVSWDKLREPVRGIIKNHLHSHY